jgi:hypothetical protein
MGWIDEVIAAADPKAARHVYWAGAVEFLSAAENDVTGRTVKLRTLRGPEEFASINPFALATRRRKGHAGTFFEMTLSLLGGPEGSEVPRSYATVLLNWSDGPQGATVTLKVSDDHVVHPFMFCKRPSAGVLGTQWMAVFVEQTNDEQPVDQTKAQFTIRDSRIENDRPIMSYAQNVGILIKSAAFALYLQERVDGNREWDAESIDTWLKAKLGIKSKTELNLPCPARTACEAIRSNYIEWSGRSQYSKA